MIGQQGLKNAEMHMNEALKSIRLSTKKKPDLVEDHWIIWSLKGMKGFMVNDITLRTRSPVKGIKNGQILTYMIFKSRDVCIKLILLLFSERNKKSTNFLVSCYILSTAGIIK